MTKVLLLDGYIDEPTCLGVPPYISPYPRYIAGALHASQKDNDVYYLTIDQLRHNPKHPLLFKAHFIIVIAGMVVPGKYLGGYPASPHELHKFLSPAYQAKKILCGPAARHGFGISGGKHAKPTETLPQLFDAVITGDPEIVLYDFFSQRQTISNLQPDMHRINTALLGIFATKGAGIVKQHPNYPNYIIAEIETYRGCSRNITGGCSFCIEPMKGMPLHRPIKDVVGEIEALHSQGIRHFRLGNQPCLFSYQAQDSEKHEFPQPNPKAIEQLYKGIRRVAPHLRTLHMDNANPGIIAHFPKECKQIIKTIIKYHTAGDVAALGMETADPVVVKQNNLKASSEDVESAIHLFNELGCTRGGNGLPELLPGLNFVFGLKGETKNTFALNYEFLQNMTKQGYLLRRINLRQVIAFPKTEMATIGNKLVKKHKHLFQQFKRGVQQHIDQTLLKKVAPTGTILCELYTEKHDGKLTFGRQLGSYPLLVGIPGVFPLGTFMDVKIVDHGFRSLTAVPYPLDINKVPRQTIEALPRIGQKRALRILRNRPIKNITQLKKAIDDPLVIETIKPYLLLE